MNSVGLRDHRSIFSAALIVVVNLGLSAAVSPSKDRFRACKAGTVGLAVLYAEKTKKILAITNKIAALRIARETTSCSRSFLFTSSMVISASPQRAME